MKNEETPSRYIFADIIKLLAFAGVFLYHFFVDRALYGAPLNTSFTIGHFSIPAVAVALFFLLSGFGLTLSAEKKRLTAGEFYKRRLVKILVPYLIVLFIAIIYGYLTGRVYGHLGSKPRWTVIFLPTGLSSYLSIHGKIVIDFGIGEWFLGALLILYLLFPLLKKLLDRFPKAFPIAILLFYIGWTQFYPLDGMTIVAVSVKIFDFLLGMWVAKNFRKISWKVLFVTLPVIALTCFGFSDPLDVEFWITLDAVSLFLSFFALESLFKKLPPLFIRGLAFFGGFEYLLFLTHHEVINEVGAHFPVENPSAIVLILLLLLDVAVMVTVSTAARCLTNGVGRWIKKRREKRKEN